MAFNPDLYEWPAHLKVAIDEITKKRVDINYMWDMYNGDHPKVWMTDKLRTMFDDKLTANMADNWIELAVDAPLTRTRVLGWNNDADNSVIMSAATNVWDDNSMDLAQVDLYRHVRIAGEGFIIAWQDDDKEFGVSLHVQDPRDIYWPETMRGAKPPYVVKVWLDTDEGRWRATVYYEVDVVRLVGPERKTTECVHEPIPGWDAFKLDDLVPGDEGGEHGFESIPVVRYAKHQKRVSMIKNLVPAQLKIDKLECNKMVAAEYGAYRKLAILTEQDIGEDDLKIRPNRALVLHPGSSEGGSQPTSIWEGSATELKIFDDSINGTIFKLFTKAYLPRHMMVNPGSLPSGDAIEADEGPYVEMINDFTEWCGASHIDLMELMGIEAEPQWRNPAVRSDESEAAVVKIYVDAGVPLPMALKKYASWEDDELKELKKVKEEATPPALAQVSAQALGANDAQQPTADEAQPVGQPGTQVGQPPTNLPG